ncbi:MAG: tRNA (adenosine(37)-N6)-threonylcarbamoyltransferase complex transferase subunit TsaD, partial [Spirochaetaceae bacterium]|jgi:N6-L-threonylcarbamoyladenine synthase|nr:tRNA (adenosine(37)-N6)-threonylcarbamoyltransferase complex transferase subunit TsaD [Spirochaetaceae bacterium]
VAKFYGFGYPGGAVIDRLAKNGDPKAARFPLPTLKGDEASVYDVSYSGLKTALINQLDKFWTSGFPKTPENIAASFQETAVKILARSLLRAVRDTGLRTIVAGGGVAANSRLREILAADRTLRCVFPPPHLCTDNAAIIAGVGYHFLARGDRSPWETTASARVQGFKRGRVGALKILP